MKQQFLDHILRSTSNKLPLLADAQPSANGVLAAAAWRTWRRGCVGCAKRRCRSPRRARGPNARGRRRGRVPSLGRPAGACRLPRCAPARPAAHPAAASAALGVAAAARCACVGVAQMMRPPGCRATSAMSAGMTGWTGAMWGQPGGRGVTGSLWMPSAGERGSGGIGGGIGTERGRGKE